MRKKKNFSKIADVLKVRNILISGVRLYHDRSWYQQVSMKEAEKVLLEKNTKN